MGGGALPSNPNHKKPHPCRRKIVTVVGAQWGDEGKGKVVDWLSARADLVVRFQGGNNAGHTLVVDGVEHRLSLLPSAVVREDKQAVIGSGVVLNPWAFLEEIETLTRHGISLSPDRLAIAETASLVLPLHARVDAARESARGAQAIGTTGRGDWSRLRRPCRQTGFALG